MTPETELILVSVLSAILESGDRARTDKVPRPAQDYVNRAGTLVTCAADAIAAKRGTPSSEWKEAARG